MSHKPDDDGKAKPAHEEWPEAFESFPDAIAIIDNEHALVHVNRAMAGLLGVTPESLVGRKCYEVMHGSDAPVSGCPHSELLADAEEHKAEIFEPSLGAYLSVSVCPLRHNGNATLRSVHVARDITEQRKAQAELEEKSEYERVLREKLVALQEINQELQLITSHDVLCRRAVELARERLGYDRVGIWFMTEEPALLRGSFGTDEQGKVRDERDTTVRVAPNSIGASILAGAGDWLREDGVMLKNHLGKAYGSGTNLVAPLRTGAEITGYVSIDDLLSGASFSDADGEVLSLLAATIGSLSARIAGEGEIVRLSAELQLILDSVPAAIWFKDTKNNYVRVNHEAAEMVGLSPEDIEGRSVFDLFPDTAESYYREDLEVIRSRAPKTGIIEELIAPNGKARWLRTDKVPHFDEHGHVDGVVVLKVDITESVRQQDELKRITTELERLSATDELTGMANRRSLMRRLDLELVRTQRTGRPMALLLMDLDNFKQVNDRFGHQVGDAALKRISETLQRALRHMDFVGRYGGEEFCAVLAETDADGARNVAEKIRAAIDGLPEPVPTISIGIASWQEGATLQDMIWWADKALYRAKNEGRNRVVVSDHPPREQEGE